jgi:6,7-dimethyl-8-ribityllumazine synthase
MTQPTPPYAPATHQGQLSLPPEAKLAIVVSRFNALITQRLLEGALWQAQRHGITPEQLVVIHVPGAFELPVVAKQLATSGYKGQALWGIVALGCVIKGATSHFDYVCSGVTSGLQSVATSSGIPVAFGVLTTETVEQAMDRAGVKLGNKGAEAMETALEMAHLLRCQLA